MHSKEINAKDMYDAVYSKTAYKSVIVDIRGKRHYGLALTYVVYKYDTRKYLEEGKRYDETVLAEPQEKDNSMVEIYEYSTARLLGVSGVWYDQRRGGRIHANLHIANELPLAYVREIFGDWGRNKGMFTIERMYEPIGWRIYAARNHKKFKDHEAEYTNKRGVYRVLHHDGGRLRQQLGS